jgi:MFS family permease
VSAHPPERSAREARRTLTLLVAAAGLCYLSMGCYVAILPGYVLDHLGLSTTTLGLVMGATAVVAVGLRPLSGGLGDRYGRRPLAVAGAVVIGGAAALLLGPGALALVLLARVLLGAGDALFTTAGMAWAADVAAPERRGRAMATIGMSFWLGLALGPQWGVLAREAGGYDAVWALAALAGLLAAALVRLIPVEAGREPSADGGRPAARLPRGALLPALAMVLAAYGNGVFEAFGIVHLTGRGLPGGAGLGGAASVFTVVAVTTFLGRFGGGVLSDRVGPRPVGAAGVLLVAGSYLVFAFASSFAVAAAGGALLGVGLALLYPALALSVTRAVPASERGAGLGVFLASMDVAFGVGPVLGGLIVSGASSEVALASAAGVAILALPLVLLNRVPPADAAEQAADEAAVELAGERPAPV